MSNFDDTLIFCKVAELGSYTQAGEQLNIPKATVSRRISQLEKQLGVKLLNRDTRKLSLTEAGHYLLRNSHPLLQQLADIEGGASSFQAHPAGELRVTIPVEIGIRVLNEIICEFSRAYPEIKLDILVTNDLVDIIKEGYDLAIRGGSPKDSNLISRKIMSSRFHLCCSAEYLQQNNLPTHPGELTAGHLLAFPYSSYQYIRLQRQEETVTLQAGNRLSANSFDLLLKAARKGLGIAVLPTSVCSESIRQNALVSLYGEWRSPEIGLYALYPSRDKTRKLTLFIEFLEQRLRRVQSEFI